MDAAIDEVIQPVLCEWVSGWISASRGGFFDGERTGVSYIGRVELSSQLALEPRASFVNRGLAIKLTRFFRF